MIDLDETEKVHKAMCCVENENELKRTREALGISYEDFKKLNAEALNVRIQMERTRELLEEAVEAMQSVKRHMTDCCDPFMTGRNSINAVLAKLRSLSPQGAPAGGSEG